VIHAITGTWTLNQPINGWARVLVYIPDNGAMDPQAMYTVTGSDTTSPNRTIAEGNYLDGNRHPAGGYWASLGSFHFTGVPSVSLDNLAHLPLNSGWGDGDRDVAWDAVAFQPLPGPPAHQVAAIGDSYISGEGVTGAPQNGAYEYYRSSDHDGSSNFGDNPEFQDACHRAPGAWPGLATLSGSTEPIISRMAVFDPALDYHMSACSGATTGNMLRGDSGQFQEGAQLDQGYLDQHTTLVMFSIGGNDARFTPVIQQCIIVIGPCAQSILPGDSAPLALSQPALITGTVEPAIEHVLTEVHSLAPNAKILLMGYPDIFENDAACMPLLSGDGNWLDSMADKLDDADSTAAAHARAAGIDVTFSDPRAAFKGQGVCGSPENIHELVLSLTRGDSPSFYVIPPSRAWHRSSHSTPPSAERGSTPASRPPRSNRWANDTGKPGFPHQIHITEGKKFNAPEEDHRRARRDEFSRDSGSSGHRDRFRVGEYARHKHNGSRIHFGRAARRPQLAHLFDL
jgi:hypothetical protein